MSTPRPSRRGTWMLLPLLAGICLAGCRRGPEPCVVTGVTVVQTGPSRLEPLGLEREDLRRVAVEAFRRTPGFAIPSSEPPQGAPRCRGGISLVDARLLTTGATTQAEVLVRLEVSQGEDGDTLFETVRAAESIRPDEDVQRAFRRAIEGGATRAASVLALGLAEARKPDATVIQDLESGDPRIRDLAVGVLAERKNAAAVPALIARLQDPDPDVADRAVGALGQIGDPRAVAPIIELSRRREGPFVAQMVRIVGDIGGPEAEAYLETMAAGHPDPLVVAAARDALRDARRRSGGAKGKGPAR